MLTDIKKINGCLLGGALGDAFGAPLEATRHLSEIREQFGPNGMQEFVPYEPQWGDTDIKGLGVIIDDTTMLACTLAGVIDAVKATQLNPTQASWPYYLAWGAHQRFGTPIAEFTQTAKDMPDYLQPFMFACGAGKGTIAALLQGDFGTVDKPSEYSETFDGKTVTSPNPGCGAMMRIAPIAFLAPEYDVMQLARENAVMTHSHPDAMNAAALTAAMVKYAIQHGDIFAVLEETRSDMMTLPQNNGVIAAWDMAEQYFVDKPNSLDAVDELGYLFERKNPFMALPILSQVVYCLQQAAISKPDAESFKHIMRLAVNNGGDTDSIGAITGNILGAAWGVDALPQDWLDILMYKDELVHLGQEWHNVASARCTL